MKKLLFLLLLSNNAIAQCSTAIDAHVYHPARLKLIKKCITVTGVVDKVLTDPDGDYHIRLRVDPAYENLLNDGNINAQHGCLVAEIICAHSIRQEDAKGPCKNYTNAIEKPYAGEYIRVTGRYVQDSNHAKWREIHPVSKIEILDRMD